MTPLLQDARLNSFITRLPELSNVTCITLLEGGLTNKNYRIDTQTETFVMRVSDSKTNLLGINRYNEKINTRRAFAAGVGPSVIGSSIKDGILLVSWINAKTLHPADMHNNPVLLNRMAASLQLLHAAPAFRGNFHFPSVRKKYLATVLKNKYFIPEQYLETEPLITALEDAIAINPEPLVPCNNDLLAENFMDDGNKIWIIDYEYAGQNEASFEIGNLASESGLSKKDITTFCKAYWRKELPSKVAKAIAWSMISRYGWVLWASIQEAISNIDFDFRMWGTQKWNSVLQELNSDDYHTILKTLKQKDP